MKSLGRFVIRPDGEARSLLLIGIAKRSDALPAGIVYEIREADDMLEIVALGPSCIGPTISTSEDRARMGWLESWGKTADALLEDCGKWLVATLGEWRAAKAAGKVTAIACALLAGCGGFGCPLGTVRVPDDCDPAGYRCELAPRAAVACGADREVCE